MPIPVHRRSVAATLTRAGAVATLALAGLVGSPAHAAATTVPPYAYAADLDGSVDAINLASGTVAASIPTGEETTDVVLNPSDTEAFAASAVADTVSVIDTSTNTVTDTIGLGASPYGLAISPSGATLYVSYQGQNNPSVEGIAVIDTATDTVASTIPLDSPPAGIALSPDGTTLYVAGGGDGGEYDFADAVIDVATGQVTASILVGPDDAPFSVAVSPDGSTVYEDNFNAGGGTVLVIDAATDTVTTTIPDIGWSGQIGADPNGNLVYVPNGNNISVLDTATDTVTGGFTVGNGTYGLGFSSDGSIAYVGSGAGIYVIDTATSTVTGIIDTGGNGAIYAVAIPQSVTPTTTSLTVSPAGTANQGDTVTLTASESPAAAGTVQFYDGAAALGAPVPVDSSGIAAYSASSLPLGAQSLTAAFTPAYSTFIASTSQPTALQIDTPPFAIDQTVTQTGTGTVTTTPFTTRGPRLLVAFTSSDGPAAKQTTTVTGAGLTWSLVQRADTKGGTAEIWTATATGPLTDAAVSSTPKTSGYDQSLTVLAFTGASGIGASAAAGKDTGAPSISLTTSEPGSWVFGVGEDYSHATARTVPSGQSLVSQWVDTSPGETFWVQDLESVTPDAGTNVTLADAAPTKDVWNMAAAEILPAS